MKNTVEVSVLITTYNRLDFLMRCVNSVLNQKFPYLWQIVIADDGSTDGTKEYLKDLITSAEFKNPQITVIQSGHVGISLNWWQGLNACTGKYITFCNDDNYFINERRLQLQYNLMEKTNAGVCFTGAYFDKDGELITASLPPKKLSYNQLLRGDFINTGTAMMQSILYFRHANISQYLNHKWWDYSIFLEVVYRSGMDVAYIPDITAVETLFNESASITRKRSKRLKLVLGQIKIRAYFISRHGCGIYTFMYVIYRTLRDMYSLIFKRWYK